MNRVYSQQCCFQPIPGPQGPRGHAGKTGSSPTGSTGNPGITGVSGNTGNTGITGPIGPQGIVGLSGSTGPSGPIGQQGQSGAPGSTGQSGSTGITGSIGPTGPTGPAGQVGNTGVTGVTGVALLVNIDLLTGLGISGGLTGFVNVGVTGSVNVLLNDIITSGVASIVIAAPPDPNFEGSATVATPGGLSIFTPAPRLLKSVTYGYEVTDNIGLQASALVKGNINLTYRTGNPSITPYVWFSAFSSIFPEIFAINPLIGVSSFINIFNDELIFLAMTTNQNDALLYHYDGTNSINVHDFILGSDFTLVPDLGLLGITGYTITGMGYDQVRNSLYIIATIGTTIGNTLIKISPRPYNRYITPGTQSYTATILTLPISANTSQYITIEPETGYGYISSSLTLYKINLESGIILESVDISTLGFNTNLSYGNDNIIYLASQTDTLTTTTLSLRKIINTATLEFSPILSTITISPALSTLISGMAEPLYNM